MSAVSVFDLKEDPYQALYDTRPSLEAIAAEGNHFSLPWGRSVKALLEGFESTRARRLDGPWLASYAFDVSDLSMFTLSPEVNGGTTTFRECTTSNSSDSTDHLSAALGLTVGYPCLNVGVKGEYDRTVVENGTGTKISVHGSCRVGRVMVSEAPPLSERAKALLVSSNGIAAFRREFGDFYVCGYELGADAGACLAAQTSSMSVEQSLAVTVSMTVLWTVSATHTETFESFSSEASLEFSGYSTVGNAEGAFSASVYPKITPSEAAQLQTSLRRYLLEVGSLNTNVADTLEKHGLSDGSHLPISASTELCRSGLVVQLLMAPYQSLEEYIKCACLTTRIG